MLKKYLRIVNIKIVLNGIFTYAKTEREIKCISTSLALQNFKMANSYFKHTIKKDSEQVYLDSEIECITAHILKMYYNMRCQGTRELGILFILLTGLRIGELVALEQSDEEYGKLYVQRTESKGKDENGHTQIFIKDYPKTVESMNSIELTDSALIVWNWIKKINLKNRIYSKYMFYEEKFGRLHEHHFEPTLRRICKECHIPYKSVHKLTKTYASILVENNVEKKIIQSQMRHTDINTTNKFYVFSTRNREYQRNQLNKADVINIKEFEKQFQANKISKM